MMTILMILLDYIDVHKNFQFTRANSAARFQMKVINKLAFVHNYVISLLNYKYKWCSAILHMPSEQYSLGVTEPGYMWHVENVCDMSGISVLQKSACCD